MATGATVLSRRKAAGTVTVQGPIVEAAPAGTSPPQQHDAQNLLHYGSYNYRGGHKQRSLRFVNGPAAITYGTA